MEWRTRTNRYFNGGKLSVTSQVKNVCHCLPRQLRNVQVNRAFKKKYKRGMNCNAQKRFLSVGVMKRRQNEKSEEIGQKRKTVTLCRQRRQNTRIYYHPKNMSCRTRMILALLFTSLKRATAGKGWRLFGFNNFRCLSMNTNAKQQLICFVVWNNILK